MEPPIIPPAALINFTSYNSQDEYQDMRYDEAPDKIKMAPLITPPIQEEIENAWNPINPIPRYKRVDIKIRKLRLVIKDNNREPIIHEAVKELVL